MNKPTNPNVKIDSCAIGIDFGTSNSAMSRYYDSVLVKGPMSLNFPVTGSHLYPSIAYLDEESECIRTGIPAYNKRYLEPERVISSVKRHIAEKSVYRIKETTFTNLDVAKSIIYDFLNEIRLTDHDFIPRCVVVTVPYYFGENENALIKSSSEQAMNELLNCQPAIFVIPEQVAASIACVYNLNICNIDSEVFFIYDIGAGTLDLTLVRVTYDDKNFRYEVLANDGIARFGGDDVDELIYEYALSKIGVIDPNITEHHKMINKARLLAECREAKHHLTHSFSYTFLGSNLFGVDGGFVEFVITRDELNELLSGSRSSKRNMMLEFQECVENIYAKAQINPKSVSYTIPVGGTSFIPIFRAYVNSIHCSAREVATDNVMDNLTLVANGASIYAAMKCDEMFSTQYFPFGQHNSVEQISTRISHSLYIEKYDGKYDLIVPANSMSPVKVRKRYFPSKLKEDGLLVDLAEVRIFQGEGDSRKRGRHVGMIDFSGKSIYTHNRNINNIPIDITIEATDTIVKAHCFIPKADRNGNDVEFTQIIHD